MLKFILPLILPVIIWSAEHVTSIDPKIRHPIKESGLSVDHKILFPDASYTHMVSIRAFPRLSKDYQGFVGVGTRRMLDGYSFGAHLCVDHYRVMDTYHFSGGPSFEFKDRWMEFTTSVYYPITGVKYSGPYQIQPHFIVECECVFKTKYLHVGVSPFFSLTSKSSGFHGRISVPFKRFEFHLSGGVDQSNRKSAEFSVSFDLFGNKHLSNPHSKLHRRYGIYEKSLIENEGPSLPILEIPKLLVPAPTVQEEVVPAPKEKSWWDFFFARQLRRAGGLLLIC